jgi:hypothetical protein
MHTHYQGSHRSKPLTAFKRTHGFDVVMHLVWCVVRVVGALRLVMILENPFLRQMEALDELLPKVCESVYMQIGQYLA